MAKMMTWEGVRAALAARLGLSHDRPGWVGVVVDGALVRVEQAMVGDDPRLMLLALVCYEGDLPHREALALNMQSPVGALALNGERYELRVVLPLAFITDEDLPKTAIALGREAGRLAAALGARRRAATLFSVYTE